MCMQQRVRRGVAVRGRGLGGLLDQDPKQRLPLGIVQHVLNEFALAGVGKALRTTVPARLRQRVFAVPPCGVDVAALAVDQDHVPPDPELE